MNIAGNKGEWSELYAFFKLLADKYILSGKQSSESTALVSNPIVSIIRDDKLGQIEYSYEGNDVIITIDKKRISAISLSELRYYADLLLKKIQENKSSSFEIPALISFREKTLTYRIKATSSEKADLIVKMYDSRTGQIPKLGFSIKSELGSLPTLLNSGKSTNFIFKLSHPLNDDLIDIINKYKNISDKIKCIYQRGSTLDFVNIQPSPAYNNRFFNNLLLIDYCMPRLLSEILLLRYISGESKISTLTDILKQENPLKLDLDDMHDFYQVKIKRLLTDIALGMTPGKVWNGVYQANGGYLVVKKNGEIICYHIYNKNEFEEYLFNNTKLDTPSTSRYEFGEIVTEDNAQLFKLNLQIRFSH